MKSIAVIDYGMGNLRSVAKALEHVVDKHTQVKITDRADDIHAADRIVFPGQGAARECMQALAQHKLNDLVKEAAVSKPFLGVCMGMQVLLTHSDENEGVDCLGLVNGNVQHFAKNPAQSFDEKIPHMGWNQVNQTKPHPLWKGIENNSRFYFVHSYYVTVDDRQWLAGETDYEFTFTSAIARDNVFAAQFHPEKSAAAGLQLLKNFAEWDGQA